MTKCDCFYLPEGAVAVQCDRCAREQLRRQTKAIAEQHQVRQPRSSRSHFPRSQVSR